MALSFDQLIRELAGYLNTTLDVVRDVYTLNLPLHGRYQEVSATVRPDAEGRQIIDFVSTVGRVDRRTDPWHLLAINTRTLYCRVAVDKEMIFVVASQLLETAQPQEVLLILREVAFIGDQLEAHLFADDTH